MSAPYSCYDARIPAPPPEKDWCDLASESRDEIAAAQMGVSYFERMSGLLRAKALLEEGIRRLREER